VPIEDGHFGAVRSGHLGGIGLNLMPTILAPNDEPELGSGGATQRHRWAGLGFREVDRSRSPAYRGRVHGGKSSSGSLTHTNGIPC
jgi:hypothetical protein